MELKINIKNKSTKITVTYKDIKSVRLKVFPTHEIKLSVPLNTPEEWINDYIKSKSKWIEEKLQLFEQTKAIEKETNIISGISTRILGKQMKIRIFPSNQKRVILDDKEIQLYTNYPEDQHDINRQFNNWWQKNSKQCFIMQLDKLYPIIEKHGFAKPKIVVKKMKTLWGSCSRNRGIINLNYYLYKAPIPCVDYVILHELAHFIYPYHNKDFYDFLTIYMPDWKERKRQLDYEIVLGV
jgi:predicted metal-dependent hydrolase